MTYNVFWKAFDETLQTQCKSRPGMNRCVLNMARFIAQFKPDILCLQEIREDVEWPKLRAALQYFMPHFDSMYRWRSTRQGEAGMITLFNAHNFKVHQQVDGDFLGPGHAVTSGRPFLALLFTNGLLVINVHMPHVNELVAQTIQACFNKLHRLLATTPHRWVILAGDFNHDADANVKALPVQLDIPRNKFNTCFDKTTQTISLPFDHIYTNLGAPVLYQTLCKEIVQSMLQPNDAGERRPDMSDHLPVFATYTLPALPQS